ncbi:unannotated protein [freshwater metagenome]|uniref:Unannotated protein n=1 Tax=freshwater metagenome TaxID=449393 RepID=A0A6J7KPH5_9ZZZZ
MAGENVFSLFRNLKVMLGIFAPLESVSANPEPSSETINSMVNSPPDEVSIVGERLMDSIIGAVVSATSAEASIGVIDKVAIKVKDNNNFRIHQL